MLDLMIPVSRATPKNGTEVVARVEKYHITPLTYDEGWPMLNVISWIWKGNTKKCSCHKLRWTPNMKSSGVCKKCGTTWKKDKSKG